MLVERLNETVQLIPRFFYLHENESSELLEFSKKNKRIR